MLRLICLILISFSSFGNAFAFTYTVELTEDQLQDRISAKMPIERKKLFVTVIFSNPDVILKNDSEKLGFKSNIVALFPAGLKIEGNGYIQGHIKYDSKKGEFFLENPEVISLDVKNATEKNQEDIRKVADLAAKKALNHHPIYKLKDNNFREKFAISVLKSVTVKDGKLILVLGLL